MRSESCRAMIFDESSYGQKKGKSRFEQKNAQKSNFE